MRIDTAVCYDPLGGWCRRAMAALASSLLLPAIANAQPPTFPDGPVRYTVSVDSKSYGQAQESRVIRSGQVDDFTWKSTPPGGPVAMPARCPGYSSAALDTDNAVLRLVQVRLAPIIADKASVAELQLSFVGHTPHGTTKVKGSAGKILECPEDLYHSEMRHLTLPLDGKPHLLSLDDSTRISISATAVLPGT
jgi:hypothetical protein